MKLKSTQPDMEVLFFKVKILTFFLVRSQPLIKSVLTPKKPKGKSIMLISIHEIKYLFGKDQPIEK